MNLTLIVAISENNVIGDKGRISWKIKEDMEQKINNQQGAAKFLSKEFIILVKAFFDAFLLLPDKSRNQLINRMDEGFVRAAIKKIHEEAQERSKGSLKAFLENPKSEGQDER